MNVRLIGALVAVIALVLVGCGPPPAGEIGTEIITAETALGMIGDEGVVLVDTRAAFDFADSHVAGAVNISRADIVVNDPYPNVLASSQQIERVMRSRGISNDSLVIAYDDNNNMDAARLWFTLKAYGHDSVQVVSGGLAALTAAGAELASGAATATPSDWTAGPLDESMIVTTSEVRAWVNDPDPSICLLDTRTEEEHVQGTIPGSILIDYQENNFPDGSYRPPRHIHIRYLESGIDYDDGLYIYCQTSIRAAQTYLALYNAGYRDLRLYDEAYIAWSANPMNEVFVPEPDTIRLEAQDNS